MSFRARQRTSALYLLLKRVNTGNAAEWSGRRTDIRAVV